MTRAKPQTWAETPATHRRKVLARLLDEAVECDLLRSLIPQAAAHHARREAAYLAAVRVLEDAAPKPKRGAKR